MSFLRPGVVKQHKTPKLLLWIENAPDYAKVKAEKIEAFVDQYISCSEDVPQEHADYLDIQKHKHSRTCRKMGKSNMSIWISNSSNE